MVLQIVGYRISLEFEGKLVWKVFTIDIKLMMDAKLYKNLYTNTIDPTC